MFYCLTGNVIALDSGSVAIDCGGVGFKCYTSINSLKKIGSIGNKVTLYTYLSVREDALDLYGFYSEEETDFFKLLLSVSGVGPKAALSLLSELTPDALALCIASGDSKAITRAQGIGAKIAQRIVLELKDKLSSNIKLSASASEIEAIGIATNSINTQEAISALVSLGYMQSEASQTIASLDASLSVEELIRQALKAMAKGV